MIGRLRDRLRSLHLPGHALTASDRDLALLFPSSHEVGWLSTGEVRAIFGIGWPRFRSYCNTCGAAGPWLDSLRAVLEAGPPCPTVAGDPLLIELPRGFRP